jgi:hypothetical protein
LDEPQVFVAHVSAALNKGFNQHSRKKGSGNDGREGDNDAHSERMEVLGIVCRTGIDGRESSDNYAKQES